MFSDEKGRKEIRRATKAFLHHAPKLREITLIEWSLLKDPIETGVRLRSHPEKNGLVDAGADKDEDEDGDHNEDVYYDEDDNDSI